MLLETYLYKYRCLLLILLLLVIKYCLMFVCLFYFYIPSSTAIYSIISFRNIDSVKLKLLDKCVNTPGIAKEVVGSNSNHVNIDRKCLSPVNMQTSWSVNLMLGCKFKCCHYYLIPFFNDLDAFSGSLINQSSARNAATGRILNLSTKRL